MKINKDFIGHKMDDGQVMISLNKDKFSGLLKSNSTASFIIDQLKEDISEE